MRPPRQIYIDLGVNFGDTLDLFERLDNRREEDRRASAAAWEVFGFEAVPSTSTYLEELFRHKNGEGARPVWCFPPVGSTFDKMRFASMLGCERTWTPKMTSCMSTVFGQAERQMLREIKVSQSLLSFESVDARLRAAARPGLAGGRTRYTFIPAAVGASSNRSRPAQFGDRRAGGDQAKAVVQIVDFAVWLNASFRVRDHVLVKMDVEGAEHSIVRRLKEIGALRLIDRLAFECHPQPWAGPLFDCERTNALLSGVDVVPDRAAVPKPGHPGPVAGIKCPCYEEMTEAYWGPRLEEFRQDLSSPACAHVNVSLSPEAVADRLMRSREPPQMRRAKRILAGKESTY